jgi:hypothetical protein
MHGQASLHANKNHKLQLLEQQQHLRITQQPGALNNCLPTEIKIKAHGPMMQGSLTSTNQ